MPAGIVAVLVMGKSGIALRLENEPPYPGEIPEGGFWHQAVSEWLAANPLQSVCWEPGCACDADAPVPATVLDPFAGSGTTGVVAIEEGRAAILIEPKAEYREIIRRRLGLAHEPSR